MTRWQTAITYKHSGQPHVSGRSGVVTAPTIGEALQIALHKVAMANTRHTYTVTAIKIELLP